MLFEIMLDKSPYPKNNWLAVLGAGIAATAALIGGLINSKMNSDTNDTNKQINDDNLKYNKEVQETTWQREDSAWQRGVADAEQAGLSPLSVTNGSTSGSVVGAPASIPMQSDSSVAQMMDAIASIAMHTGDQMQQKEEFYAKQEQDDKHFDRSLQMRYDEMSETRNNLELQIQSTADENEKKRLQDALQFSKSLEEQIREFDETSKSQSDQFDKKQAQERFFKMQEAEMKRIQQVTGGKGEFKKYYDRAEFDAAQLEYSRQFERYIATRIGNTSSSTSQSYGESQNTSFGAGVSIAGTGANASSTLGGSVNGSGSSSVNESQRNQALMEHFYMTHPKPVFVGDLYE